MKLLIALLFGTMSLFAQAIKFGQEYTRGSLSIIPMRYAPNRIPGLPRAPIPDGIQFLAKSTNPNVDRFVVHVVYRTPDGIFALSSEFLRAQNAPYTFSNAIWTGPDVELISVKVDGVPKPIESETF